MRLETGSFCRHLLLVAGLLLGSLVQAAERWQLGIDQPFLLYEDATGQMTLDAFLQLPATALALQRAPLSRGYTASAFWLRAELPAALFDGEERWLRVDPVFLDHLTLHYRPLQGGPWQQQQAGDRWAGQRSDLDYRFPVLRLPPPEQGYELVVRVQSSSALLLSLLLAAPADFLSFAARGTAFWSFYFGMLFLTLLLSLIQALLVRTRLLWSICLFSLVALLLVVSVQGYIVWLLGPAFLDLQHYLTSALTLLIGILPLWIGSEALHLEQHRPRFWCLIKVGMLLLPPLYLLSLPLGLFSLTLKIQSPVSVLLALLLAGCAIQLWRQRKVGPDQLLLGLVPVICLVFSIPPLLILHGVLPYYTTIYATWQYALIINVLLMVVFAALHTRKERRLSHEYRQLDRELNIEREARFHQRQFMGLVSHEFRTPLAVISGALQNLPEAEADPVLQRRYHRMQRATDRLIQLTDNCLADARLSASALHLERSATDLGQLLQTAAIPVDISGQHRLQVSVQGQAATLEQLPALPLEADTALLGITLSNLLDNAVKYTDQGCIRVGIQCLGSEYVVHIRDEGQGIPATLVDSIFERYSRGGQPAGPRRQGTGLGLYVARQIALAHGGNLALVDTTPQGCCFELRLPRKAQQEP